MLLAAYPYTNRTADPTGEPVVGQTSAGCRSNTWIPDLVLPLPTSVLTNFLPIYLATKSRYHQLYFLTELLEKQNKRMDVKPLAEMYYLQCMQIQIIIFIRS